MKSNQELKNAIHDFNRTAHELKKDVRRNARETKKLIKNVAKDLEEEINETFREYRLEEQASNDPGYEEAIAKARREKIAIKREIRSDAREIRQEIQEEANCLIVEINNLKQDVADAISGLLIADTLNNKCSDL